MKGLNILQIYVDETMQRQDHILGECYQVDDLAQDADEGRG